MCVFDVVRGGGSRHLGGGGGGGVIPEGIFQDGKFSGVASSLLFGSTPQKEKALLRFHEGGSWCLCQLNPIISPELLPRRG